MIQEVKIGNEVYEVRSDYTHRGQVPRLVLNTKVGKRFLNVQFEDNGRVISDIEADCFKGIKYSGYSYINIEGSYATPTKIEIVKIYKPNSKP